jgi:hypothetical protein
MRCGASGVCVRVCVYVCVRACGCLPGVREARFRSRGRRQPPVRTTTRPLARPFTSFHCRSRSRTQYYMDKKTSTEQGAYYTEVLLGMNYANLALGTADEVAGAVEASSGACVPAACGPATFTRAQYDDRPRAHTHIYTHVAFPFFVFPNTRVRARTHTARIRVVPTIEVVGAAPHARTSCNELEQQRSG